MQKISIKDIAKLTGVSTATVSRVLNDNGRFSEETRKKVLQAVKETGYQTNFNAKSLRSNKTYSIGVLVPDLTNYFFGDVVKQIESVLFSNGYSTIITNTDRNEEKEKAYINMLVSKMVDGLIVISGLNEFDIREHPAAKNIPYICIDREPKHKFETIFVSSNHYQGGFDAADSLISHGVKNPVMVIHNKMITSTFERINGFKDALKKNSLEFNSEQIIELKSNNKQYNNEVIIQLLTSNTNIDGVFALNDDIAAMVLYIAQSLDINVPNDLQIIGFDNTPLSSYTNPTLSTISQDTSLIAATAVSNLISLINNKSPIEKNNIFIPVELIERNSLK